MPITELVFPAFKTDAESVAAFKTQAQDIFQSLSNIEGLQAGFQGPILEENGSPVDPKSMRSILVLGKEHTHTTISISFFFLFPISLYHICDHSYGSK